MIEGVQNPIKISKNIPSQYPRLVSNPRPEGTSSGLPIIFQRKSSFKNRTVIVLQQKTSIQCRPAHPCVPFNGKSSYFNETSPYFNRKSSYFYRKPSSQTCVPFSHVRSLVPSFLQLFRDDCHIDMDKSTDIIVLLIGLGYLLGAICMSYTVRISIEMASFSTEISTKKRPFQ